MTDLTSIFILIIIAVIIFSLNGVNKIKESYSTKGGNPTIYREYPTYEPPWIFGSWAYYNPLRMYPLRMNSLGMNSRFYPIDYSPATYFTYW
jgi:hypothetical protein